MISFVIDTFAFFCVCSCQTFARAQQAKARVAKWRDWKNWSSLARLLLAISYGILQLYTFKRETVALKRAQAKADANNKNARQSDSQNGWMQGEECTSDDDDDDDAGAAASDARMRRLQLIREMRLEQIDDMTISFCNLGILLKRLRLGM
jgi:hypothetical protein